MAKSREKDPVTGANLNRLTNYNNSEPVNYRTDIDLGRINIPGSSPRTGSTGDANLFNYESSRYDNNIQPYELGNLEDIRSQNQGSLDALARSTANLIGKTAVNVVGGLAGTAYGAVDAIGQGRISALWDNDLTTALDEASQQIGDYFKVYKSEDFEESNLIAKAVLHPLQFTDQLMDTLSFTTGAVVTELISGGLASGSIVPRALKYFKNLGKAAEAAEVGANLASASNRLGRALGNAGTLSRQLATGAAYEASIEARHASMELRDNLYNQWLDENPSLTIEDMPEDVRNNIDERLSNAGLFTFLSNLALVGGSNIVQFPKVFGAGYNTSKKAADLTNRITRNAAGTFEDIATSATRGQRALSNATTFLRNPIMEGLVEEGGQGVIGGLASDYFARKFDLDSKDNVKNFIQDFAKNLADTYTTAEGWEEIGMGMIIGSLGSPGRGALSLFGRNTRLGNYGFNEDGTRRELWDGGIVGAFRERAEQTAEIAEYINELNQNSSIINSMKANYDFLIQSDSLDKSMDIALQNNDVFNFNNYRDDKIHSYISSRIKSGLSSDLEDTVEQLKRTDYNDLYVELRGQDAADKATSGEKRFFKNTTIDEFERKIKATTDAYNTVDEVYTGDNEEIRDYFAHSIATAKYLDIREKSINDQLGSLSNNLISNLNIRGTDTITINEEINRLNELVKSDQISNDEKSEINRLLTAYNNIQDKQRSLTSDEYQALARLQSSDPVTLSLNIDSITDLLNDSRKIRNRRQSFIEDYNNMFTEEGIKKIQRQQRKYLQEQERIKQEQDAEIAKQQAEQNKLDEELRVQNRKSEIQAKKEATEVKKNQVAEETQEINEEELLSRLENFANNQSTLQEPVTPTEELNEDEIIANLENFVAQNTPVVTEELTPEETVIVQEIEYEQEYDNKVTLKQDGLVRNSIEPNTDEYRFADLSFKRDTANTIISLNVNYAENVLGNTINQTDEYRIFDGYTEDGRLDINSNFDSRLQDPNQFNIGTTVNIIIPTYAQIEARGIELAGYTQNQYNDDINNIDRIPIAFTDNEGKIIGYLPTRDNVERRVASDYLDTELIKNRDLRTRIFENRGTNMTAMITNKTSGTPMFQRNQQLIYEALGDNSRLADGVQIGIFKEGKLQVGLNNVFQNGIKLPEGVTADQYFSEGLVYAIVPTAVQGEHFALNMNVNTLDDNAADVIVRMLELYKASDKFATDTNLLNERERLSVEVDFTNYAELNNALESILYINNDNDAYMFRVDNNKLILGLTPDLQFTWNQFRNPETKNRIKDILQNRFYAVRLANFGNPFNGYILNDNNELEIIRNRNYNDYLNDFEVLTTNIQSEPISNKANERYFTAQSVISIGNINIAPRQLGEPQISSSEELSNVDTTVSTTQELSTVKKPKNKLGLKIKPNKNKPRLDEDFSEIHSIDNLSLDAQAEELMKKCSQ